MKILLGAFGVFWVLLVYLGALGVFWMLLVYLGCFCGFVIFFVLFRLGTFWYHQSRRLISPQQEL